MEISEKEYLELKEQVRQLQLKVEGGLVVHQRTYTQEYRKRQFRM